MFAIIHKYGSCKILTSVTGAFEYFQYLIHCVDLFSPFCNNLLLVKVLNQ